MILLFAITLFLSAILLFWIQPLVAKLLLPILGGTPAVWNTCLLFFQVTLLGGYAYALVLTKRLTLRNQVLLHIALLLSGLAFLPLTIGSDGSATNHPVAWLLWQLASALGVPVFLVSATAPLLQRWFAGTRHTKARDPYFLYALSNAGSLLALLGFPLVLEPYLRLQAQTWIWGISYAVLAVLISACGALVWRSAVGDDVSEEVEPEPNNSVDPASERHRWTRRLLWTALAFVPSSLVLGVTIYITTDIAAVPLLWIVPLALYLITFIIAFARRRLVPAWLATRVMPGALLIITLVILSGATEPAWFLLFIHLLVFFIAALVCHNRLAEERPQPQALAEFYLWIAIGGALGGVFNAILAPLLFNTVVEYPLAIVLACLLIPTAKRNADASLFAMRDVVLPTLLCALTIALAVIVTNFKIGTIERLAIVIGVPLMLINHFFTKRPLMFALGVAGVMLGSSLYTGETGHTLYTERNFYGTLRVTQDQASGTHLLYHGSTIHGRQFTDEARRCEPLSYYHRRGPLGSVFEHLNKEERKRIAVIGLGTGATIAYAVPNQQWTFYEINPAVVELARDERFFTYLGSCAAVPVETVLGDARLRLGEESDKAYDLIVLDAFSSDAVPVHLLTSEALALYLAKLADGGWLAFHVSNRSLNLQRVVSGLVEDANLSALVFNDRQYNPANGKEPSQWIVVARRAEDLNGLREDGRWRVLEDVGGTIWRDDFSNVVEVFKGF